MVEATQGTRSDTTAIRRKPVRGPLPTHLPRERVVIPGTTACSCCSGKLAKLGEDVTETLEVIPREWKVTYIQLGAATASPVCKNACAICSISSAGAGRRV